MVRVKHPSAQKTARTACNALKTTELLTMLKAYIDPVRKDGKMVAEIFKTLESRIKEHDESNQWF